MKEKGRPCQLIWIALHCPFLCKLSQPKPERKGPLIYNGITYTVRERNPMLKSTKLREGGEENCSVAGFVAEVLADGF